MKSTASAAAVLDTSDLTDVTFSSNMLEELKDAYKQANQNTQINKNAYSNPPLISPNTSALKNSVLIQSSSHSSRGKVVLHIRQ